MREKDNGDEGGAEGTGKDGGVIVKFCISSYTVEDRNPNPERSRVSSPSKFTGGFKRGRY